MIKGYKVFNSDWTCRDFQYEVGKTYEMDDAPVCCIRGFHFCEKAVDCFDYYLFNPNNKVAEIIALGEVDINYNKSCTNKIQIVREIPWNEVLEIVNTGKGNSGIYNSGNRNSRNCNSGDYNSGDYNSGNYNSGDCNSGSYNSGNYNSGDCNSGSYNSGNWNSGNCNSGSYNSGRYNSGNCNSGDWNKGDCNTGCFNTTKSHITFFNKPTNITLEEWKMSEARYVLDEMPEKCLEWIPSCRMSDAEKEIHPEFETTGGYPKEIDKTSERQEWWNNLPECDKKSIKAIPNFDAAIFEEITGIKVE